MLSVVIPTFNRAELLRRVLGSLAAQDEAGAEVEVIVVDDGSSDHTAEVVASHPGVTYLHQANAGPAAARNNGFAHARGDFIAFTDDDTVPDRRWAADLAAAFSADPGLAAVGGTVRPLRVTFLTKFVQVEQHASHGVGPNGEIKYLVTANCAYRREVLDELGGFDETFPVASGEDTDLTLRAQAKGYRMQLLDGAVVLHDHPSRLRPILKNYLKHGRTRHVVLERNPDQDWGHGQPDVVTLGHWRRRYRSYRAGGLGAAGSLVAVLLRFAGLVTYGVGMGLSKKRSGFPRPVRTIKVVVACPGADHVARGYERVTRELTAVLRTDPGLSVSVVKGSGRSTHETVLPCLRRDRAVARGISRPFLPSLEPGAAPRARSASGALLGWRLARRQVPITPYEIEALTFGVALVGYLLVRRPDLLVLQDVPTARVVHAGRALLRGRRPRILFVNGTPWPAPYPFADLVQHVTPVTWDADPAPESEKVLLQLGTNVPDKISTSGAAAARERLDIPEHEKVVISVGTMLDRHKRRLHVIHELARLPEPRPFLVIAGAPDVDQDRIESAARDLLGTRQRVVHVGPDELGDLLACADLFVLASLQEGFGLAYLEALAAGLPTIAHDDHLQRWILGPFGTFVDMTEPGALTEAIGTVLAKGDRRSLAEERRRYVADRYSWNVLRDDYLALVRRAASGDR